MRRRHGRWLVLAGLGLGLCASALLADDPLANSSSPILRYGASSNSGHVLIGDLFQGPRAVPEMLSTKFAANMNRLQPAPGTPARGMPARPDDKPPQGEADARSNAAAPNGQAPPEDAAVPDGNWTPIDLASALRLAGVQNLELVSAQQRVEAAVAMQQLAAAQILPVFNFGGNYDAHTGGLQQSSGNVLNVNRNALYIGAGANAVAAGTVAIPGLGYNLNISMAIFKYLESRQITNVRGFERRAAENEVLLKVALAYSDLLHTEAARAIAILTRNDAEEVARLTDAYFKTGLGRQADAERAATELARREQDVAIATATAIESSNRLRELLNLDPTIHLHTVEPQAVPQPIVPTQIPVPELLTIAIMDRPELQAKRAAIAAALLELNNQKMLPFSPNAIIMGSGGIFGGGSSIVASNANPRFGAALNQPRFGNFGGRTDLDLILYWSLQNVGVGNKAMIDAARARLSGSQFAELAVLDQVRQEVADANARIHSRYAELEARGRSVRSGQEAIKEDMIRVRGHRGLPIELLDSLRQLARERQDYLETIIGFNQAEFELYVALGTPPADTLARPVEQQLQNPPKDSFGQQKP